MTRAVLIMFVAMSCIPAGDAAGKLLVEGLGASPLFVAFSRFALGTLMIAPFAPPGSWALLSDWRIWLRGFLLAGGICSILTALGTEPIANVFAAFFIGPLISYALSVVLLGERVTAGRTLLMLMGFAGVLLVVRPGYGGSAGLGWAVLAGMFYGGFLTASRWLSGLARPRALLASQLLIGALVTAPFGLGAIPPLTMEIAGLATASALFSMLGNLLLLVAYARAGASQLAPLVYFQLIAATGLGWVVFGALPDALTWAGLAVIVASGMASAAIASGARLSPSRRWRGSRSN